MSIQVVAPSSPSSSSHSFTGESKYRYDVFLSFRGKDTRDPFTVPLYNALRRKGINAFIDDKKLGKGKRIAPALLKAIERSRISIIVFSSDYATSTWCLDELAHIVQCKDEKNQVVMPIFYKVDPVTVQYQRDSFEEAMADHEDRLRDDPERVQNWRYALSEAASSSKAWLFKDEPGYDEGMFIERIVEDVYVRLPPKRFQNTDHMVGLEPRIKEVMSLLNETDSRVCMLGVYGTGGIGKTTLAKAVYYSIFCQFEGSCFLFDVKETSRKFLGKVHLQQKLLSDILEEKVTMFGSVDEGISIIKHRLSRKKVLLVLDDVDEVEQLEQLAGGCDWFGNGSKVIITTRNRQLLISCNVEKTYEMMKLDEHDSLELFCCYAFHMNQPPENYQDLSSCAISYADGLPLALRVIGSNLADKNFEEWSSILEQYKRIPERTIHEVLKISYNCLQDGAKRIFLDIACFFDKKLGSIKEIVEACDFGAKFYLEVLVDKSLITLTKYWFSMHDLVRQMGREIVRKEAPLNPEKRSRLWYYKDILKVLREDLGCNNIEGIMLAPPQQEELQWSGTAFEKMNNLRILIIQNVQFSTGPQYLPNSLRWLEWEGYPSTSLPTDFSPLELVFLKLPESSFRLKEPFKFCTSYVTYMDFSNCEFTSEVPDMSQLQSLRTLRMRSCNNLIKVHDSVGFLSKLVRLYVNECPKLSIFPRKMKMAALKVLEFTSCRSLDYFPHIVGKMDSLELISIHDTAIKQLPPSIGNLSNLEYFSMYSCKNLTELPISLFTLPNLWMLNLGGFHPRTRKSMIKLMQDMQPILSNYMKNLNLTNCGLVDEELRLILSCFPNLKDLYLPRNDFVSLPKCIKECTKLRWLEVSHCKRLRHIPELPSNLMYMLAENCTSLTAQSMGILYSQAKRELPDLDVRMPAKTKFPGWFDYCCEGSRLCFRARRNLPRAILAFEVGKANTSIEHSFLIYLTIGGCPIVKPAFDALRKKDLYSKWCIRVQQGHVLLVGRFMQFTEAEQKAISKFMGLDWNDVKIQVISESTDVSIVKCGVYVYKKETNMEDVQFDKSCDASTPSLKRRAITAPPNNYEPPNKFMRTDKGKLSNPKKRTRRIKGHQTFGSRWRRKMVFPMGRHVWRLLYACSLICEHQKNSGKA